MRRIILLVAMLLALPLAAHADSFQLVNPTVCPENGANVETSTDIEGDLCAVGDGSGEYEPCWETVQREAEAKDAEKAAAKEAKDKALCKAKKCLVVRQESHVSSYILLDEHSRPSWSNPSWRCECLKVPRAEKKGKK
jgi:hypothetical protein